MYLIANWKENKEVGDLQPWVEDFLSVVGDRNLPPSMKIIIAPSFPLLFPLAGLIKKKKPGYSIQLAAQDLSEFPKGAHTGEVSADQLDEVVKYVILGHSERKDLGETPESTNRKIEQALENNIIPIFCFSGLEEVRQLRLPMRSRVLYAYEPVESIGTGNPASTKQVRGIYSQSGLSEIIYGGSVDKSSIQDYLKLDFISGFLIGGASLNASEFASLVLIAANKIVSSSKSDCEKD